LRPVDLMTYDRVGATRHYEGKVIPRADGNLLGFEEFGILDQKDETDLSGHVGPIDKVHMTDRR